MGLRLEFVVIMQIEVRYGTRGIKPVLTMHLSRDRQWAHQLPPVIRAAR